MCFVCCPRNVGFLCTIFLKGSFFHCQLLKYVFVVELFGSWESENLSIGPSPRRIYSVYVILFTSCFLILLISQLFHVTTGHARIFPSLALQTKRFLRVSIHFCTYTAVLSDVCNPYFCVFCTTCLIHSI